MKPLTRTLTMIGISAAALATLALPASAAHESNNRLQFAPVAESPSSNASGAGTINYVKGTSGEEPFTEWTSSFRFNGLAAETGYSVVIRDRFADDGTFSAICSFTTNSTGAGSCTSRFTGLQRLAIAQLRLTSTGAPVLQATRQIVVAGPGSITSSGGCREPDQAGTTCAAPGRN